MAEAKSLSWLWIKARVSYLHMSISIPCPETAITLPATEMGNILETDSASENETETEAAIDGKRKSNIIY